MEKLLIVKIAAIGDVVMSLPLLSYFKKEYPHLHITWISGEAPAPLLGQTGLIDELIVIDEHKLFKGSLWEKFLEVYRVWKALKIQIFDLVITAHIDLRYRLFTLFTYAKKRRQFKRPPARSALVPGRYHTHAYLALASGKEGPHIPLAPFPSFTSSSLPQNPSWVALAPGGAKNVCADDAQRRWPIEYYVSLAQKLSQKGFEIILTGSSSDAWILPYFEGVPCKNEVGKTTLLQLLDLYQQCALLITHDSGPLHLAKLVACPVLALFGPTNPYEKVSPATEKITVLWGGEHLPCRPCYNGKVFASCTNPLCMKSLTAESVFEKALALLKIV